MITLSIIGLVYMLSIPNLNLLLMRQERALVLDNLTMAIAYAQSEALKQKTNMVVCGSSNNRTCNPSKESSWDRFIVQRAYDHALLKTFPKLQYGTLKASISGGKGVIVIENNGRTNKTNGMFYYCPRNLTHNNNEAGSLIVNDAGRTYLNKNKNAKEEPLFCM